MTESGDKLDALAGQMTGVLVSLAGIGGDVKAVLGRMDAYEGSKADHEARLRAVESLGLAALVAQVARQGQQLEEIQAWRWKIAGAAAALGGGLGYALNLLAGH